jgi:hypothetical protein
MIHHLILDRVITRIKHPFMSDIRPSTLHHSSSHPLPQERERYAMHDDSSSFFSPSTRAGRWAQRAGARAGPVRAVGSCPTTAARRSRDRRKEWRRSLFYPVPINCCPLASCCILYLTIILVFLVLSSNEMF